MSFAAKALKATSEGQWCLAVWSARQALFASDLAEGNFDAALLSGLEYLKIQAIGSVLKEDGKEPIMIGFADLDSFELTPVIRDRWAEGVPSFVFEPILATLCSTDKPLEIDFEKWRRELYDLFRSNDMILNNLEWMQIGLRATFGDEEAIQKAKNAGQNPAEQAPGIQRLAQLICCASKALSPLDCISAQASFLVAMPAVLNTTVLGQAFTRMVARRWIYLATEQKFFLSSPTFYASRILGAASQPVPTISECANLLLIIGEVTRLTWPQPMLRQLKELSQQS